MEIVKMDKSFNGISKKFARKIYGGLKGKIRLAVIWRDLTSFLPIHSDDKSLRILDIGSGLGQHAMRMAKLGHEVVYNDTSAEMLAMAKKLAADFKVADHIEWHCCPYQHLKDKINGDFDLVLCHALIEWLARPEDLISDLTNFINPRGSISLSYYNKYALEYRNLLRGNFKIIEKPFLTDEVSLTPSNPMTFPVIDNWLDKSDLKIRSSSGIRVFYDYASNQKGGLANDESVIEMELKYSNREPYKWLGRYVHLICEPNHGIRDSTQK